MWTARESLKLRNLQARIPRGQELVFNVAFKLKGMQLELSNGPYLFLSM